MHSHRIDSSGALVSVIIPTYNRQALLLESIQSVLEQSYRHIEIVVVDNQSDDETYRWLQSLNDPRIKFYSEPRRGAAYARNTGVRHATGALLSFLDSDDLWLPHKLEEQVGIFEALSAPGMVFGEFREFFHHNREQIQRRANGSMSLSVITLLMRRADFLKVGYFAEHLAAGEFMEWYARATDLGLQTLKLSHVMALRRIHEGNSAGNRRVGADYLSACRAILAQRSRI
jgi:glycosyltransferase involved in cell wall biosynthesis